jgi:hypothetical protein
MKKIVLSSIMLVSGIFIIGCGSGGSDSSNKKESVDNVLKLSDVVYNAPQDIDFKNKTTMQLKRQVSLMKQQFGGSMQKADIYACSESGTMSTETFADNSQYIATDNCLNYDSDTGKYEYMNGKLELSADGNTLTITQLTDIPDAENYPTTGTYMDGKVIYYVNGDIEESYLDISMQTYNNNILKEDIKFDNFTLKYDNFKQASYFDGRYYYKSGCFQEDHTFKTDSNNWLVENSTNSNYYSSGILTVDNIKYVYSGVDVTITKDNITKTFTQQEFIDELNKEHSSDSSCYQQGNFGV